MPRNPEMTNVDIRREIAKTVHAYCIFNDLKMNEFVSGVLEEHLVDFKKSLENMARLD